MTLERTAAAELAKHEGMAVRVCGWVHEEASRAGGAIVVRDRSGLALLVGWSGPGPGRESAVEVVGTVVPAADGPAGVAVAVDELVVVGPVLAEVPITPESSLDRRLDWRFLDLRRPANLLVFEVQTTFERAMREVWAQHGFIEIHSPKLRSNPNRSGRELFSLKYFDRQAYLAQSPQFYKQMAMASGFERVFEIGPVFRANPLVTSRHDTEFTSVDVEMSWIESHEEVMCFEEQLLNHAVAVVNERHGDDIAAVAGRRPTVPTRPFPRVALEDARRIAEAALPGTPQPPGDLDASGERALGDHVARELGHELVFVTDYPAATRPFYHMRASQGSPVTRGFDLLWNGMEVTTGAQREHRYDRLVDQAGQHGVPLEPIAYYLDCFRFGCPPHGGFGLGLTRVLMCLFGRDDVREVTYLHRGPDRLIP